MFLEGSGFHGFFTGGLDRFLAGSLTAFKVMLVPQRS